MNFRAIFIRIFASRGRVEFKRRLVPSSVGSSKSQTNEPACHAGWKKWWDLRGCTYYITIVIYIYIYDNIIGITGNRNDRNSDISILYIYIHLMELFKQLMIWVWKYDGIPSYPSNWPFCQDDKQPPNLGSSVIDAARWTCCLFH